MRGDMMHGMHCMHSAEIELARLDYHPSVRSPSLFCACQAPSLLCQLPVSVSTTLNNSGSYCSACSLVCSEITALLLPYNPPFPPIPPYLPYTPSSPSPTAVNSQLAFSGGELAVPAWRFEAARAFDGANLAL